MASSPESAESADPPTRRVPGRTWLTWVLGYGMPRAFFRAAARRGDLVARLETDASLQAEPWTTYDELRGRGVVAPGKVAWATASHAAATHVLRDPGFSVGGELPGPMARTFGATLDPWAATVVDAPSMLAVDAPDHTRYRRLVSRAFTARAVGGLEDRIRGVADALLDTLERDVAGRPGVVVDLVDRYAALLPVAVIADLLGVPDDMHAKLLAWGNEAARTLDPTLGWRAFREAEVAMRLLHRWFAQHVRDLRAAPGDDLISRLLQTQDSGDQPLTDHELRMTGLLVLGAGFETTVNLIGNAVYQLSAHPEQRERALADPALWPGVVEETLRYDSPVQVTLRVPRADTDVLGVTVPRGTPLLVLLGGANRDPAVFADPHTFDVGRPNAGDHLAFSSGAHFCLGASLARREAQVGLQALYERFPGLDAAGVPERRDTRVLRGFEHLPVTTGARRATHARPGGPGAP